LSCFPSLSFQEKLNTSTLQQPVFLSCTL
jgi:hypothetical protein